MTESPAASGSSRLPRYLTFEEFIAHPSDEHAEWVNGEVIPMHSGQENGEIGAMVGGSKDHSSVSKFLVRLLSSFAEFHRAGEVYYEPFMMRLAPGKPARSPGVLYVSNEHADRLRDQYLDGPADLVVEVISPGTAATDRGTKYFEYEEAGIPEYWLIDPLRRVAEFYRLGTAAVYELVPTPQGTYESVMLPGLTLRVSWLWDRPPMAEVEAALGLR
ncbi:MAG: Uma2 family endonuclease [Chloroflexi bacterium]|nr:Uma2 family endonuclease [Chloroflexota bacterium]